MWLAAGGYKELQGPVPRHEMFGREENNNADIITADCSPCPGLRLQICNSEMVICLCLGHTFYIWFKINDNKYIILFNTAKKKFQYMSIILTNSS